MDRIILGLLILVFLVSMGLEGKKVQHDIAVTHDLDEVERNLAQ